MSDPTDSVRFDTFGEVGPAVNYGEYPEFSDEAKKDLVAHLLAEDHHRAHQRKNEATSRQVRDSLTQRMLLNESAQEWVKKL